MLNKLPIFNDGRGYPLTHSHKSAALQSAALQEDNEEIKKSTTRPKNADRLAEHFENYKNIESYCRLYPQWRHALITCAIEKVLESHPEFELVEGLGFYDDNGIAFERIERNVGLNKKHFCFGNGTLLINKKSEGKPPIPFAISLSCYAYEGFNRDFEVWILTQKDKTPKEIIKEFFEAVDKKIQENNFYKNAAITPDGEFLDIKKYNWSDLIVEDEVKSQLQTNIIKYIENQKLYLKYNVQTKRGILLSGQPGTGKSLTGKIIANQVSASFLWVTPKFLTESDSVDAIFDLAREIAPTIIYFEDVDLYALDREDEGNRSAVLGEILNKMDGIVSNDSVITVMTTNYPDKLEKALKDRPGRFDCHIQFKPPSTALRIKMYQHFSKDCITDGINWDSISTKGENFSGAHLHEVITYSKILAIESGSMKDDKIVLTNKILKEAINTVIKYFDKIKETIGFLADDRKRNGDLGY